MGKAWSRKLYTLLFCTQLGVCGYTGLFLLLFVCRLVIGVEVDEGGEFVRYEVRTYIPVVQLDFARVYGDFSVIMVSIDRGGEKSLAQLRRRATESVNRRPFLSFSWSFVVPSESPCRNGGMFRAATGVTAFQYIYWVCSHF